MGPTKLFYLALVVAFSAIIGSAFAESAAVTNYKQQVTRIVDTWTRQMSRFNDELTKAKADLDTLKKQTPAPADLDKQVADLQTKIKNLQASMDLATNMMRVDIGLLTVDTPKKEEALPLPGFVKDLIKAKGIPLAKNVSVLPNATLKGGSISSVSLVVTVTFP
jgi:hypothetical protein